MALPLRRFSAGLCVLSFLLCAPTRAVRAADTASLDGTWQWTDDGSYPAGWTPIAVPHHLDKQAVPFSDLWLARDFVVPPALDQPASTFFIHFQAVNYAAQVFVNGQLCSFLDFDGQWKTKHADPHAAFDVDISAAVLLGGQTNQLEVHLQTWESAAVNGGVLTFPVGDTYLQNKTRGINDSVSLVRRPLAWVEDVYVQPSWRYGLLNASVTVDWSGGGTFSGNLRALVIDPNGGGALLPTLGPVPVTIPAGGRLETSLSVAWGENSPSPATLWSPENPKLYTLRVVLDDGANDLESMDQRFGYAEFYVQGVNWFLNGRRVRFRSDSWITGSYDGKANQFLVPAFWEGMVDTALAMHQNLVRNMEGYLPELFVDTCDERGLMVNFAIQWMYVAGGFPTGTGGTVNYDLSPGSSLWNHLAEHVQRIARQYRSHPSIALWALENEVSRNSGKKDPTTLGLIKALEDVALRQMDPIRPAHFEGEGPLVSDQASGHQVFADIWSQHYSGGTTYNRAVDHPNLHLDYEPFGPAMPTFHGEFIWSEALGAVYRPASTIFLGDRFFVQPSTGEDFGMALLVKSELERNRLVPVLDGQQPFVLRGFSGPERSMREQAARRAYVPLEALVTQDSLSFAGGQTVDRDVLIDNQTFADFDGELNWALYSGGLLLQSGFTSHQVLAGEQDAASFSVTLPTVSDEQIFDLRVWLSDVSGTRFFDVQPLRVTPAVGFSGFDAVLALYDPAPGQPSLLALQQLGLSPLDITPQGITSSSLAGVDVLVLGAQGLAGTVGQEIAIQDFLTGGGRLLCLEQDQLSPGLPTWTSAPLALAVDNQGNPQETTIGFTRAGGHPVIGELDDEEFQWWGRDNLVARHPFRKYAGYGWLSLVESSAADGQGMPDDWETGVSNTLLFEHRLGAGLELLCALDVIDKFDQSGPARVLLHHMLAYLEHPGTQADTIGFRGPGARTFLELYGAPHQPVLGLADPLHRHVLPATGQGPTSLEFLVLDRVGFSKLSVPALASFVRGGGRLLLRRLQPADMPRLSDLVGLPVSANSSSGDTTLLLRAGGVLAGVNQQDTTALQSSGANAWDDSLSFIESGSARILAVPSSNTSRATLALFALGDGLVVVDQTALLPDLAGDNGRFGRLGAALLTCLSRKAPLGANPGGDADGDGLSNLDETLAGLDPHLASGDHGAAGDFDHDGLSNADEIAAALDPTNRDFDLDGLIDGAELLLGSDPQKIANGYGDVDGDGLWDNFESDLDGDLFSNEMEAFLGTDMTDPFSFPVGPPSADSGRGR